MKQEKPIILNQNENHFDLSPLCHEVLNNITANEISHYSHVKPHLPQVLSDLFHVEKERIILGYGSEDIMKQAIGYILQKGDKILLPKHGWLYYKKLAAEVGAEILLYSMEEKEDTFSYNMDEIVSQLKQKPKMMMIASPNNPTSDLITKKELDIILLNLPKETFLIFDEAYVGFGKPDYDFHTLLNYPNVMVLRTFSKFYALAGMRISYAFIGDLWNPFKTRLDRYLGFNHLTEKLAIASLNSSDYYADVAKQIQSEAERYFNELRGMGIKTFKTQANFIFARLSKKDFDLLKEELPKRNIIIKFFDAEKEPFFEHCIRISIGLKVENDQVLEAFHALLNK